MSDKPTGRPPAGDRDAIVADYRDGLRVNLIAERHAVSPETVRRYARDAGVSSRLNTCRCRTDHVCDNCAAEIPLTGGAWVLDPVRRVQVWEEYAEDVA